MLIWLVPLPFLLQRFGKGNPLHYLKLDTNISRGILWGIIAGILYLLFFLGIDALWGDHRIDLNQSLLTWVSGIILVGFIEELPFRGFILQKLEERFPFIWANAITASLFLLAHFPGWISHHYSPGFYLVNVTGVLIRGFFFGWLVKRTDSLWSAIIFHMINNFVSFTIFG